MLETTRIRREGYAVRPRFEEFVQRFRILAFGSAAQVEPGPMSCQKILRNAKITDFLIGRSKVFLRYFHVDLMDELVVKFHKAAVKIQTRQYSLLCLFILGVTFDVGFRGFRARKLVKKLLSQSKTQKKEV